MTPKQSTIFEGSIIILVTLGLVGWFIIRIFTVADVSSTVTLAPVNLSAIDPSQVAENSALKTLASETSDEGKYFGVPVEFPEEVGKDNIFE